MSTTGYTVALHDKYVLVHLERVLELGQFEQAAEQMLAAAEKSVSKRLLLFTEVDYDKVGPIDRMEGMRVAESFGVFNRIAVCATDPKELAYLKSSTDLLIMGGVVKDPKQFRHFSDLKKATAWITAS